jgi:fused signal recognition particle receptor
MLGLFKKFKDGLTKTAQKFAAGVGGLFGQRPIDSETLDQIEEALYGADFGVETTNEIIEEIRTAYKKDKNLHGREAAAIGAAVLRRVLTGSEGTLNRIGNGPTVVALIGVNGSGKTTTCAKLGWKLQQDGAGVIIGACDTFRAAANEQLRAWSERLGLELVSSQHGADAAAVAFDTMAAARARSRDYVILDTAGRLHTKSHLMDELAKVRRVLQKHDPAAPHHSWLVIDGSHGSNAIEQAKEFNRAFGLTGLVVTKLDGTARGGALVGIYRQLKLPVYFLGFGEQPEDLQPYSVDNYVKAVFGLEG